MDRGRYFCTVKKIHHQVVLSVGCNMGDCCLAFLMASARLEEEGIRLIRKSSLFITQAWGNTNQNDFLNQVWIAETTLTPEALMATLKSVEGFLGRVNHEKWQSRPIDIDILFFDDLIINNNDLKIPHPFLAERKFVLIPLAEMLPEMIHPEIKKTVQQILNECSDNSTVTIYKAHAESN